MRTITALRAWMTAAEPEEKILLASRVGTSIGYLRHVAEGRRRPSAALGAKLETQTKIMSRVSGGRLPVVYRTDVVDVCRECEYARKCLGARAVVSDFPIITEAQLELDV